MNTIAVQAKHTVLINATQNQHFYSFICQMCPRIIHYVIIHLEMVGGDIVTNRRQTRQPLSAFVLWYLSIIIAALSESKQYCKLSTEVPSLSLQILNEALQGASDNAEWFCQRAYAHILLKNYSCKSTYVFTDMLVITQSFPRMNMHDFTCLQEI